MSEKEFKNPYNCPVCFDGVIEKELWEMLYGKNLGLHTCGHSPKHLSLLKVWIGKQLDAIDGHGCNSCWSDGGKCSCASEREEMRARFLSELASRIQHTPGTKHVPVKTLNQECDKLRSVVEWIAAQQNLFFAECSQAEEIVKRCRDALEIKPVDLCEK